MTKLRALVTCVLVLATTLVAAPGQAAAPAVAVSPNVGAPGAVTTVTGTDFPPSVLVDMYFDYQQVGFVATSGTGGFSYALTVPTTATPGAHTITGLVHNGSTAAQKTYTVRTNWPQWRGEATGRGNNRFENVLDYYSVSDLDLEATLASGVSHSAAAITAGGYIYSVGSDGHLRGYLRTTYAPKFDVAASASQLIPPIVAGGAVITTGSGQIQARSTTTGALIWTAVLPAGVGAPVVNAGVVYVVAEGSTTLTNGVYAFSQSCGTGGATCTPLWIGAGGFSNGGYYLPEMSLSVGGGRIYARLGSDLKSFAVGCGTGGAICMPLSSVTGSATGTSPVFANNYVYSLESSGLAVRRASCLACSPAWIGSLPGTGYRTATVAGSRIYVVQDSSLYVFDSSCGASTCSPTWSTTVRGGGALYPPTVANGVVYVPGSDDVVAYPTSCWTGCPPLWTAGSGGTYGNAPYATATVSDGKVYVPSITGVQIYSTAATPTFSSVDVKDLEPDPKLAAAEERAEQSLAATT